MDAERLLLFAETLRTFAQHSGRDLNAANLFVHTMLMRAILAEEQTPAPTEAEAQTHAA
jgi:hypothetical protein